MKVTIPNSELLSLDPFYRYKRDTVETRSCGKYLLVLNFTQICKQLHVEEKDLQNHLKKDLHQSVTYYQGYLRINATLESIETSIEKFISKYVLCKKCTYPELASNRVCNGCGDAN